MNKNNSETILEELSNITTANDLSLKDLNLSFAIFEKIMKKDAITTKNKTESEHVGQVCTLIIDCNDIDCPRIFTNQLPSISLIACPKYC